MSLFQLDPASVEKRVQASGRPAQIQSIGASLLRGTIGFTLVSVAGFCPWALGAKGFHETVGEAGMYAACAAVFVGLSGLFLHKLIIGPGSLPRFYALFTTAFVPYAVAWTVAWMTLQKKNGHVASLSGLLAGTALMGWILARAFEARGATLKTIAILFILNTLGYYVGGWAEGTIAHLKDLSFAGIVVEKPPPMKVAMLSWGVCYGLGFGAGLGLAFYFCQAETRSRLSKP